MPHYRLDSIAQLARQMNFTPADTRTLQLSATEVLLHDLDPARAYPLDFIIFRITGYRPKMVAQGLLTGLALQHDLGLLIEQVSETLDLSADQSSEPVLTIDDVAERFSVTRKTIQRWRRRGLPARRFQFADGRKRVAFLLSSVERFIAGHQNQISRTANISPVTEAERSHIIRGAHRLATQGCCDACEISRRLGRHFRRSPLAILHTIRKHNLDYPDQAIPIVAEVPLTDCNLADIVHGHKHGLTFGQLAEQIDRPCYVVYRALMNERLDRINRRRISFIDDTLYHGPDAANDIERIVTAQELAATPAGEQARIPRGIPGYFTELYRTPLLTATQERNLFLKFNFHKYQFVVARRRLDEQLMRSRDLRHLEGFLRQCQHVRNQIIRANLRLVVSVARKHLRSGLDLMELISEGNITLMRAVESFDPHKGNRFSTYATLSLMKGFARSVPKMQAGRCTPADELAMSAVSDVRWEDGVRNRLDREQVACLLSRLNDQERMVLSARYGLGVGPGERAGGDLGDRSQAATLMEVAATLNLSHPHVHRIERSALAKLRAAGR